MQYREGQFDSSVIQP
nr:unnamed protein product [Callosobruchus chinensis]